VGGVVREKNGVMVDVAELVDPKAERVLLMDEQGRGLRATWHLDRGCVNLSIWRDDRCSEAFQLSIEDSSRLAGFLVAGLGESAARRSLPADDLGELNARIAAD
jgi:hypothetical protein